MIDYDVPLKGGGTVRAKVVNWPKVFFSENRTPCKPGEKAKEALLKLLSGHLMPAGTEDKYYNTIDFFDCVAKKIEAEEKANSVAPTGPVQSRPFS